MLPFKNRLTKRKDFEEVQKKGQFFSEDNIAIKHKKNSLPNVRIGVVVGLKFSTKAVERNRMKRYLRGIMQEKIKELAKNKDVIVMIRKKEGERIYPDKLQKNIENVLQKSGLIIKK